MYVLNNVYYFQNVRQSRHNKGSVAIIISLVDYSLGRGGGRLKKRGGTKIEFPQCTSYTSSTRIHSRCNLGTKFMLSLGRSSKRNWQQFRPYIKKSITYLSKMLFKCNKTGNFEEPVLKVNKFRKQIFQPKLLPKNQPTNLFF